MSPETPQPDERWFTVTDVAADPPRVCACRAHATDDGWLLSCEPDDGEPPFEALMTEVGPVLSWLVRAGVGLPAD